MRIVDRAWGTPTRRTNGGWRRPSTSTIRPCPRPSSGSRTLDGSRGWPRQRPGPRRPTPCTCPVCARKYQPGTPRGARGLLVDTAVHADVHPLFGAHGLGPGPAETFGALPELHRAAARGLHLVRFPRAASDPYPGGGNRRSTGSPGAGPVRASRSGTWPPRLGNPEPRCPATSSAWPRSAWSSSMDGTATSTRSPAPCAGSTGTRPPDAGAS